MVLKSTDNKKDDKYYFAKIIDDIGVVEKYLNNASYEEFLSDEKSIDAIMFRLIQLVENVKMVSKDFKNENTEIEWYKIIGFRNGIVHEYGKTDYSIVYEVITKDLNHLKKFLKQHL
ncbi:MAG: DUF86 domain-containing protein [Bacilli bacterium]|nr:DUF86 domain-containing protein [Bacilli bacterium]